ncbi:hypothetical protein OG930_44415 [Streptomyces sp. NBC_01799]|nr:hypothetical protein OG930_01045 [Streptomyces sp. NBC_01799]WSA81903.1 hypothetical protein OG930_44415 [Streptomyces sp. NBC_01799]
MTTPDDHTLLRRAIALAAQARAAGNPPFGSLLSGPDGTVLAEEHNTTLTDQDITAHPELKLARWAARELHLARLAAGVDPAPPQVGADDAGEWSAATAPGQVRGWPAGPRTLEPHKDEPPS